MNLIQIGSRIINLDHVAHAKKAGDEVTIYFAVATPGAIMHLTFDGNEGKELWKHLVYQGSSLTTDNEQPADED